MRRMAWAITALGLLTLLLAGCMHGQTQVLTPSSLVPAASFQVALGTDSNGNTTVDLEAQHLAQPSKLSPPASDYVVWVEPNGMPARRKGVLRPGNNLKASLRFITTEHTFTLLITAENGPSPTQPSSIQIAHATLSR